MLRERGSPLRVPSAPVAASPPAAGMTRKLVAVSPDAPVEEAVGSAADGAAAALADAALAVERADVAAASAPGVPAYV